MKRKVVYFIKGAGGIKIGVTSNLASRFVTLSVGSAVPLEIIRWVTGGNSLERALHQKLKAYRLNGEWFCDCNEVRAVISDAHTFEVPTSPKPLNEFVQWASKTLPAVAHPRPENELMRHSIGRVAEMLGFTYSRTFELWYGKARTLTIKERNIIETALESSYAS